MYALALQRRPLQAPAEPCLRAGSAARQENYAQWRAQWHRRLQGAAVGRRLKAPSPACKPGCLPPGLHPLREWPDTHPNCASHNTGHQASSAPTLPWCTGCPRQCKTCCCKHSGLTCGPPHVQEALAFGGASLPMLLLLLLLVQRVPAIITALSPARGRGRAGPRHYEGLPAITWRPPRDMCMEHQAGLFSTFAHYSRQPTNARHGRVATRAWGDGDAGSSTGRYAHIHTFYVLRGDLKGACSGPDACAVTRRGVDGADAISSPWRWSC